MKPAHIQLDFLVRRLAEIADPDPSLKERRPYSAAASGDLAWFGNAVTKHYQGDDSDFKVLGADILAANSAITTEDHAARVTAFFDTAQHPTLRRPYAACGYVPMVDWLRYLETHRFTCYIVSGGGRDSCDRSPSSCTGIPPERVVGSSVGLEFRDGNLYTIARPEFVDDGPVKPVRIWGRTGRRPILAAGNS